MKKFVLGISMLFCGIIGMTGIIIAAPLTYPEGFGPQGLTECIISAGMLLYFLVFIGLSIAGLYIAHKEAYNVNNEN